MKISKQLAYSFFISVLFVLTHIIIERFQLSDLLNLILSLSLMFLAQSSAFVLLKKYSTGQIKYLNIFLMLFFTQFFVIILLSLNSAFNPLVEIKPLDL